MSTTPGPMPSRRAEFALDLVAQPKPGTYDGVVLAVAHWELRACSAEVVRHLGRRGHVLYDSKPFLRTTPATGVSRNPHVETNRTPPPSISAAVSRPVA